MGGTRVGSTVTPTGDMGKFKWSGSMSVFPSGGGVDEVRDMTISIANSTPVTADTTSD